MRGAVLSTVKRYEGIVVVCPPKSEITTEALYSPSIIPSLSGFISQYQVPLTNEPSSKFTVASYTIGSMRLLVLSSVTFIDEIAPSSLQDPFTAKVSLMTEPA